MVTIYTKPGCPYCMGAKEYYRARGVAFKEVGVAGNAAGLSEMLRRNGGTRRVPTIVEDGEVKIGFNGGT
jgi:glutaredoxin 3